jgi:hypothetical protein
MLSHQHRIAQLHLTIQYTKKERVTTRLALNRFKGIDPALSR